MDNGTDTIRDDQRRRDRRNYKLSRTRNYDPRMSFTVRSVSDRDSERGNSFVRNNGLNKSNPIYKLEGVLRKCYQDMQSQPDMYGIMRRDPKKEANPLLCNLKTPKAIQDATEALIQILNDMFNKIPDQLRECSTIPGIGSHRIIQFQMTECKVIQERIALIRSGSESGRRKETLHDDEISVYDEGTKDYIESNRLLDFVSNFYGRLERKPTDMYWSTD